MLDDLEKLQSEVMFHLKDFEEHLPTLISTESPNVRPAGVQEKRALLMRKLEEYPPELFINDAGETRRISAWSLAQSVTKGGDKVLREIEEAFITPEGI